MFIRLLATALFMVFIPNNVNAADFYLGAGVGPKLESGVFRRGLEQFSGADGVSWKLIAGVELNNYWALEFAPTDLGKQRCCGGNVADAGFDSLLGGYSLAALARWPVGDIVPFLKVGLFLWSEDGDFVTVAGSSPRTIEGTDLHIGAGVELALSERIGLRAEWDRYDFDGTAANGVMASLVIRFGQR